MKKIHYEYYNHVYIYYSSNTFLKLFTRVSKIVINRFLKSFNFNVLLKLSTSFERF